MTQCRSFFNMVNHNPPMISVSMYSRGDAPKDTTKNIIDTKEFTVNIISEPFVEAANFASVESPAEIDEWVGSGLTREPSVSNLVSPSAFLNVS
jgi:flavin reductase (DIM6/NTAB) family NADH-FMN oxidoreductase RutF